MRSSEETAVTPDSESVDAIITTMPYLCLKERRHRKMMLLLIFHKNMFPSHPLHFSSAFQLGLLFPPASSSPLHLPSNTPDFCSLAAAQSYPLALENL